MNCEVILIVLIGLTSTQTIQSNETTTDSLPSDVVIERNNITIAENNSSDRYTNNSTDSSVIEFFGANEENSTAVDQNVIQKPNITSNVDSNENKKNRKYRIRNYSADPLLSNAQSPNPFVSGAPGSRGSRRPGSGVDPQIALLLQNNPRLRLLAEQNPQIAQQIMRNPRLLRDPRIANAIRAQLGDGGGGGLLSLLPGGLGAALNPLGIGLGGGQRGPLGGSGLNQNDGGGLFGAPRGQNRRLANRNRANEENIGGGYYGNNRNYGNNRKNNQNVNNQDNSGANEENNANNEGAQDYDNSGQEGGEDGQQEGGEGGGEEGAEDAGAEEGQEGQEAQDPSQDPANDPDIQQLQNLGGGVGDNFPEGLFPPGLLSKEDLDEIRKQQEKQAREQAEKERQQQQGGEGGGEGQDYDYGNGANNANGANGEGDGTENGEGVEETPEEGTEEGGEENTTAQEEPVTPVEPTPAPTPTPTPVYRANPNLKYKPEFGGVRQGSVNNPGVEYDEILDVNAPVVTPPSFNSVKPKGKGKGRINSAIPPAIPVPGIPYRGQQPIQPYLNPQQGLYQQPVAGQVYGQQPQYPQQPIQYYPQYQPNYVPQQQFVPQQYPQQYVPQPQYVGQQQPGQYLQQPLYQPIPIQQQGYLPQQRPVYNQFPQNINLRAKQQGYNNPNQLIRGGQPLDPNIANHKLNTIPHDESEDSEDYDNQTTAPNHRLSGLRGRQRSFQQQPRIFSSSAQNTESSVAYNTTEPSVDSNKFNNNSNSTYDDIRQRTHPLI